MASTVVELIQIITDLYHQSKEAAAEEPTELKQVIDNIDGALRKAGVDTSTLTNEDSSSVQLKRSWLAVMLVFCSLNSLADLAFILSAVSVLTVLDSHSPDNPVIGFRVLWSLVIVNWIVEVPVGLYIALGRNRIVSAATVIVITNLFFTAVQQSTLTIGALSALNQPPELYLVDVLRESPPVRAFFYLSLIQGISFGLSSYNVAIWCHAKYLRGGNLFLSVLGIPYACKHDAYRREQKWPVRLVRTVVYIFLGTVLCITVVNMGSISDDLPQLERIVLTTLQVFMALAILPFIIAGLFAACCCVCGIFTSSVGVCGIFTSSSD